MVQGGDAFSAVFTLDDKDSTLAQRYNLRFLILYYFEPKDRA